MNKPDCYKCIHRRKIPGDAHSECKNTSAAVKGDAHGIRRGWFFWPFNFDPVWLVSCDGFEAKEATNAERQRAADRRAGIDGEGSYQLNKHSRERMR